MIFENHLKLNKLRCGQFNGHEMDTPAEVAPRLLMTARKIQASPF